MESAINFKNIYSEGKNLKYIFKPKLIWYSLISIGYRVS
jgi:hypothetical protein